MINQKKNLIYVGYAKKILLHFIVCLVDVKYFVITVLKKFAPVENVENVNSFSVKHLEYNVILVVIRIMI